MNVFIDPALASAYDAHPLVLVDVGARGGLKKNWAAAAEHLQVYGFEPDPGECARLTESTRGAPGRPILFNTALADHPGTIRLHITRDAGLSSIFEPNRPFIDAFPDPGRFDVTRVAEVAVETLDDVLRGREVVDVDFLKVDTQGAELLVLRGARATVSGALFGIEVEVEFASIYKDQPLFADVDPYLRALGFELFDLRPVYWKRAAGRRAGGPRGQLAWADALYLKSIAAWREALAPLTPELRKSKLLRAFSVCELYGYRDYALELLAALGDVLTSAEQGIVERSLRSGEAMPAEQVSWIRRRVSNALHRLWRVWTPRDDSWSVSRSEIGNLD